MSEFEWFDDGLLRCRAFDQFAWQTHVFGSRAKNPVGALTQHQIHSAVVTDAAEWTSRCRGDALVANQSGTSIGIRTADCVPILLVDPQTRSIAAIHAGWRGTAAQIASETLRSMKQRFGAQTSDMYVAIGPCIGPCCYQVGQEVARQFQHWTNADNILHLDLAQINVDQFEAAGVPAHQIFAARMCTFCQQDRFFSYRRDPSETGRMISAVTLLS